MAWERGNEPVAGLEEDSRWSGYVKQPVGNVRSKRGALITHSCDVLTQVLRASVLTLTMRGISNQILVTLTGLAERKV